MHSSNANHFQGFRNSESSWAWIWVDYKHINLFRVLLMRNVLEVSVPKSLNNGCWSSYWDWWKTELWDRIHILLLSTQDLWSVWCELLSVASIWGSSVTPGKSPLSSITFGKRLAHLSECCTREGMVPKWQGFWAHLYSWWACEYLC